MKTFKAYYNKNDVDVYGDDKGWSGSKYVFINSDGNWAFSDNKVIGSKYNIFLHAEGYLPSYKVAKFGTHAVLYENNEMGDEDLTWQICEIFKGEWVTDNHEPILEYQGDTIIKIKPLFELQYEGK